MVFGSVQTGTCAILGQRVDRFGNLYKIDGTPGEEPLLITGETGFCADPSQPRVQFNNEWTTSQSYTTPLSDIAESLVAWRTFRNDQVDIYGQRVVFYPDSIAVKMGLKTTPTVDSLFFCDINRYSWSLGRATCNQFSYL